MPVCKRCKNNHFNFQACPPASKSQPVEIRYRKDVPEGFKASTKWGYDSSRPVIYSLPARQRTGSLIGPDGNTYTPEPLPPDAA